MKSPIEYYIFHETLVDPELALKKREVISENVVNGSNGNKLCTITYKQVLQSFDTRNWNGRKYTQKIVMDSLNNNAIIQNDIREGTWAAEYGHPIIEKGVNEISRQMTIYPPNACNTINKYWVEGNLLMGECTTLAGGWGDVLRDRILTGVAAMASSRAVGGVDKMGNVLPGYIVITFDSVFRPSHKEAYMIRDSVSINNFGSPTPSGNAMTESAYKLNLGNDAVKDFLLTESYSKNQIELLCGALSLDYSTLEISNGNVKIKRITEDAVDTVVMPINRLVNTEYYNLF